MRRCPEPSPTAVVRQVSRLQPGLRADGFAERVERPGGHLGAGVDPEREHRPGLRDVPVLRAGGGQVAPFGFEARKVVSQHPGGLVPCSFRLAQRARGPGRDLKAPDGGAGGVHPVGDREDRLVVIGALADVGLLPVEADEVQLVVSRNLRKQWIELPERLGLAVVEEELPGGLGELPHVEVLFEPWAVRTAVAAVLKALPRELRAPEHAALERFSERVQPVERDLARQTQAARACQPEERIQLVVKRASVPLRRAHERRDAPRSAVAAKRVQADVAQSLDIRVAHLHRASGAELVPPLFLAGKQIFERPLRWGVPERALIADTPQEADAGGLTRLQIASPHERDAAFAGRHFHGTVREQVRRTQVLVLNLEPQPHAVQRGKLFGEDERAGRNLARPVAEPVADAQFCLDARASGVRERGLEGGGVLAETDERDRALGQARMLQTGEHEALARPQLLLRARRLRGLAVRKQRPRHLPVAHERRGRAFEAPPGKAEDLHGRVRLARMIARRPERGDERSVAGHDGTRMRAVLVRDQPAREISVGEKRLCHIQMG